MYDALRVIEIFRILQPSLESRFVFEPSNAYHYSVNTLSHKKCDQELARWNIKGPTPALAGQ